MKYSGRKNPNSRYNLDDNFFSVIDGADKAYILGFIASDGSISEGTIDIEIHGRDKLLLTAIAARISDDCKIRPSKITNVTLSLHSKKLVSDVCSHLDITPGPKSHIVNFPHMIDDTFKWDFIRGFFDGDGSINKVGGKKRQPRCKITSNSIKMLSAIKDFCNISCSVGKSDIWFSGNSALDFMGKLYDDAKLYMPRKKDLYLDWASWVPSLTGFGNYGSNMLFRWNKTRDDAVPPSKSRASDSGYDIVILEKIKEIGNVELWDTGIKLFPEYGWYFDLVPRSSIIKRGYVLANMIGIIDRTYTGNVIVALTKIDPNARDMIPGEKIVQLIPRQIIHVNMEEVSEFDETERNSGGFGSTEK